MEERDSLKEALEALEKELEAEKSRARIEIRQLEGMQTEMMKAIHNYPDPNPNFSAPPISNEPNPNPNPNPNPPSLTDRTPTLTPN